MKILQLVSYYAPERMASTHLANDREEAFAAAGFNTEMHLPTPTRGLSKEEYARYKDIRQEEKRDGKLKIYRFPMYREGKNPIARALRYLLVNVCQYAKGTRAKDVDVILCGSTPPTQGTLCGLIKRKLSKKYKRNVPFVFILQDIFPDSLVNAKMTKKGSLIWKVGRKIEDFTYRSADKIIVISEGFKRNIMAKGVPEEKIVIIPNWIDVNEVYPIERKDNVLFDRYNLDREKFYVCYSGNIGHSQNLSVLLEAAKKLEKELPNMCFVLIGEGAAKAGLEESIRNEGIGNIIMLPFQPYEEIAHVFSLGDAGLIISKPGIGGSSVPSKTWSIMAAEKPIIASFDEDSELTELVKENNFGVAVGAGDADRLCGAVRTLYENREAGRDMGRRARQYVCENLNKEKCTGMYVETIKSVQRKG